ncbi:DNA polymerase III [Striga asiatica]|uniref:DNA polymerase III n=1 Tax=Striga asiatica TaxID=4170 RepID=A0A5A7R689_STRAF|nr:DNA polymerase III [Striga asiatica]
MRLDAPRDNSETGKNDKKIDSEELANFKSDMISAGFTREVLGSLWTNVYQFSWDPSFEYWFDEHRKYSPDLRLMSTAFVKRVILSRLRDIPKKAMPLSEFAGYLKFSCIIKLYHTPKSIYLRVRELEVRFSAKGLVPISDVNKVDFTSWPGPKNEQHWREVLSAHGMKESYVILDSEPPTFEVGDILAYK